MFKIYDGREAFYQWDIDQKVVVEDRSITQVHFCNRTDDCALICECYELEGKWVADVPNILLQDNWRIRVYAYDGCATRHDEKYDVKPRSKPDTYVYTETEVLSYETIAKRMDAIETDIEGVAEEVIKEYLEEHDIKVDLTGYATEEYVDNAVSAIELTPGPAGKDGYTPVKGVDYFDGQPGKDGKDGVDGAPGADGKDYVLTEADKQEIAGMVEVTGGGGSGESIEEVHVGNTAPVDPNIKLWVNPEEEIKYATEQYVDDAIANLDVGGGDGGDFDAENYYTKTEVDTTLAEYAKKNELPNVSIYATKQEIANAGYQTAADVNAAITLAFSTLGIAEEEAY